MRNSAGEINEYTGNISKQVSLRDEFMITLTAEDPEGLHEITLSGSSGWDCESGNFGEQHGPTLGATRRQILEPDADNTVSTSMIMITNLYMGPYRCGSGFRLIGAGESLVGTGTNFFGGRATARLSFGARP